MKLESLVDVSSTKEVDISGSESEKKIREKLYYFVYLRL